MTRSRFAIGVFLQCALLLKPQTNTLFYMPTDLTLLSDMFEFPDTTGSASHLKILSTSRYAAACWEMVGA